MPIKVPPLDVDDLIRRYHSGESIKALAESIGVSRPTIIRRLKDRGIPIRDRSAAMYTRMANTSEVERKQLAKAANAAMRGQRHSNEHRVNIAKTREMRAAPSGTHRQVIEMLESRGFPCVPEKAVGKYNLDIAHAKHAFAVEIFGGNWHATGRHAARFPKRTEYLLNAGWSIVFCWISNRRGCGINDACIEQILSYFEIARRNKTGRGDYLVIRGDGKTPAFGRSDENGGAVIPESERRNDITGRYNSVWE